MIKKLLDWRFLLTRSCVAILIFLLASTGSEAQTVTTVGVNNGYNGIQDVPCPLQDGYEAQRAQYLYTEAELNAAGIMAGATINSIGWDVQPTFNNSWNNQPILLENYTISLDTTTTTSLASNSWETGPTVFSTPTNYTYTAPGTLGPGGYISFAGSFVYNGGNLLVEVCSGIVSGDYTSNPVCAWTTGLSFNGSHTWRDDNVVGCGNTNTANFGPQTTRPVMIVNFTAGNACAGAPVAGTIIGPFIACAGQQVTLSLNGATVASGITYQWEESPVGLNTWTPLANGTTSVLQTNLPGEMDYRCTLTCGATPTTTAVHTISEKDFYVCYCSPLNGTPLASSNQNNYITNVEVVGTSLNNPTTTFNNNGYSQFDPPTGSNTTTLYPGLSYTLVVNGLTPYVLSSAGAWIDFDADGVMDNTTELITLSNNNNINITGMFTVPPTAITGLTGFRVRINDNGNSYGVGAQGPCSDDGYGETEDYVISIGTLSNCSGQPSHSVASGPSAVCPNGPNFNLTTTGMSAGSGITYDWQSNDGSGWLSTGNTSNYHLVAGGITLPTSYRMITHCTVSNSYDTSSVVAVAIKPAYECYCSPLTDDTLITGYADNFVASVEIFSTSLINTAPSYNLNGYSPFSSSVTGNTATLYPGITYTIQVGALYNNLLNHAGAWIDFDGDGVMDNLTEFITLTNSNGYASGNFTVPVSATPGLTGLRIRINDDGNIYGGINLGACDVENGGEIEDYVVTIATLPNCSGQPAHATASGPAIICPNSDFSLVATGMTAAAGITYEWQSDDGNGWISTGVTNTMLVVTGGITVPMSYRLITLCGTSNLYDTSNVVAVALNPFYLCYCSPLDGTDLSSQYTNNFITSVEIVNTQLNNPTNSFNANSYSLFNPSNPNYTTTLYPGFTYTINIGVPYSQLTSQTGLWIDYDSDGSMSNTNEFIALTGTGNLATATFIVPPGAIAGMTGLRVRVNDWGNTYGGTNQGPCDDDNAGETEDYAITIGVSTNCSGQPAHATVNGPVNICEGIDFTLSASGLSVGTGITYDWQSDDGTGWTTTGSASNTHTVTGGVTTPTSYRVITHCTTSNLRDTSSVLAVGIKPFYECYCSPLTGNPLASSYSGNYVGSVNVQGTTLNYGQNTYSGDGYLQFIPSTINTTATLLQGGTYTIDVATDYLYDVAAWIDYDADGVFDNTTEFIAMTNSGNSATGSFTIPTTATLGTTGLRVRANSNGFVYGGTNQGPCDDDQGGETEDYLVTLGPVATCPSPTGLLATAITTNSATISWVSAAAQHEIEYAPGGTFAIGTGTRITAGSSPQIISLNPSSQYSYYVRALCGPGDESLWTLGTPFYTLCAPITIFPWDDDVEGQPVNQGNGQMVACWIANPVPNNTPYEWWVGSGAAKNSNSGPSGAHSGSKYFYTETNSGFPGSTTTLTSPETDISGLVNPSLEFYYHMFGNSISKLVAEIYDGVSWNRIDSLVGQHQTSQASPWGQRTVSLAGYSGIIKVRFEATRGFSYNCNLALDDIAITGTPLAIKLDRISAINMGSANRIEWNTLSEEKTDKFELQRSADGKNFEMLAPIDVKGQASRYTYMDHMPFTEYNYYRLRMTEGSGKVTYSDVVKAFVKTQGFAVEAYPNPVSNNLTISTTGVQGIGATVELTDVTGKVIWSIKMSISKAMINMNGLANGIYLIKYTDASHTQTIKIHKQ